jgi:PAS domain S-box-containing protein
VSNTLQPESASLAQEAVNREARHNAIFASLSEGVVIQDLDGRIIECNSAAERILGLSYDEMLGLTSYDPRWPTVRENGAEFPPEERPGPVTLRTGQPQVDVILGIRRADGELRWLSVNSQALRSTPDSLPEGVVLSFTDITPMRRMSERLLETQKLESVARLDGGIAHDFNNLLTAVLGYAELSLNLTPPHTPLAGYLTQIVNSADRAATLTRQLLAFARRQKVRPEHIDLRELLSESLSILRPWVGENVAVRLECEPGLWMVHADPGQLQQLLLNLASNASEAMPSGGSLSIFAGNTTLKAAFELAPGDYVEMRVVDSGVGMSPELVGHVFEPFFTTKEVGEGSGLGLATCYGIVRQHGGSISVSSRPGEGTTVTVRLPRAVSAQPASV